MPITVTEDETESGGFALIDLGAILASSEPSLSFRRQDAEPRHLGSDGWQPEIAWLPALSAETVGGRSILRYGPSVVDRIEELVPIELVGEDGRSFGIVSWPYVTPAPASAGVTIEIKAVPVPIPEVLPPPELVPVPVTVSPPPVIVPDPPAPPPVAWADMPPPPADPPSSWKAELRQVTVPALVAAPPRRRFPVALGLAAVLLLGLAGVLYAFRDRLPWLPALRDRGVASGFQREFADLLRRKAEPEAFVAFGQRALEAGQGATAFRAFDEADPVAVEEAAWQLGRFYDPRVGDASYREAAAANAGAAAYYYALWKGRSARLTDELRGVCANNADAARQDERLRNLCQS